MSRVVIITGAGSGIGQAAAVRFASMGDWVVAADINGANASATKAPQAQNESER